MARGAREGVRGAFTDQPVADLREVAVSIDAPRGGNCADLLPRTMAATCARGPRAAQVRAAARAQRRRTPPPAISLSFQHEQ